MKYPPLAFLWFVDVRERKTQIEKKNKPRASRRDKNLKRRLFNIVILIKRFLDVYLILYNWESLLKRFYFIIFGKI